MATTNMNMKVDDNLKKDFSELCDKLSVSMSMAIAMFMSTAVRQQSLNFLDLSIQTDNIKKN